MLKCKRWNVSVMCKKESVPRLHNLKKNVKGLGGKGKLTNSIVNKLQNYYGIAIRSNVDNLSAMKKAVHAALFHVASSTKNNWHEHCPDGVDSWCRFKQDKATGKDIYKPGVGLPLNDLSKDELLEKCLHGLTQNQNESFNGTIWDRLPKSKYVAIDQLIFGVYDAVGHFNIGSKASILTLEKLNIVPGRYTLKGCSNQNKRCLFLAGYKNRSPTKRRRKVIRVKKKRSKEDKDTETEGKLYEPGGF